MASMGYAPWCGFFALSLIVAGLQTPDRLNLSKLKKEDDDITGGYILEYKHGDNPKGQPTINNTMYVHHSLGLLLHGNTVLLILYK